VFLRRALLSTSITIPMCFMGRTLEWGFCTGYPMNITTVKKKAGLPDHLSIVGDPN